MELLSSKYVFAFTHDSGNKMEMELKRWTCLWYFLLYGFKKNEQAVLGVSCLLNSVDDYNYRGVKKISQVI